MMIWLAGIKQPDPIVACGHSGLKDFVTVSCDSIICNTEPARMDGRIKQSLSARMLLLIFVTTYTGIVYCNCMQMLDRCHTIVSM